MPTDMAAMVRSKNLCTLLIFLSCILNNHYVLVLFQTLMNVQKIQMGAPKTATTLWVATLAHAMLGTDSMLMVAHVMVS